MAISPVPQAPPSARDHPRGAVNVAALRDATNSHSINGTFRTGVALSAAPIAEHSPPVMHTSQGMLAAVITEHALHWLAIVRTAPSTA